MPRAEEKSTYMTHADVAVMVVGNGAEVSTGGMTSQSIVSDDWMPDCAQSREEIVKAPDTNERIDAGLLRQLCRLLRPMGPSEPCKADTRSFHGHVEHTLCACLLRVL